MPLVFGRAGLITAACFGTCSPNTRSGISGRSQHGKGPKPRILTLTTPPSNFGPPLWVKVPPPALGPGYLGEES